MGRYLITGGAGFIGSHLVHALVSRGDRVRVFDDFSSGRIENLAGTGEKVEVFRGDLRDLDAVRCAARGVDAIFHEGALVSVPLSIQDPVATHDINVGGTLNVLLAAREERVRRVVFASSTAVYGDTEKQPKSEDDPFLPLSPYAASKCAGELYGMLDHRLHAVPFVALRYFNVFGPGQDERSPYSAAIPLLTRALLRGERPTIFGDGAQTRDFVYIDDVVQANLLALEKDAAVGGVFNVACGEERDLCSLAKTLARIVGAADDPRYAPPRAGDIRRSLADTRRAASVLAFRPRVPFEEGLRRTVDWYRGALAGRAGGEAGRPAGPEGVGR
jgi:UDP-glucose 4-epimerase